MTWMYVPFFVAVSGLSSVPIVQRRRDNSNETER